MTSYFINTISVSFGLDVTLTLLTTRNSRFVRCISAAYNVIVTRMTSNDVNFKNPPPKPAPRGAALAVNRAQYFAYIVLNDIALQRWTDFKRSLTHKKLLV